ncbi:MAG TPA: alpha/beta fold hydrolase [Nocardioides sp.]|nr:alpha/beta fold hydrolase [Nocardioides sp.]
MAEYVEVPTPDGRLLEVLAGDWSEGHPLLFHHGTPGAAVPFSILERAAEAHGFRVISYSRPGYGGSTPWPFSERGPRIVDDAVDSLIVLHHLGLRRFATLGWSGGGPRALACAAINPERCRAVATLASVAPYDAAGLDWTNGMADENVEEFAAAVKGAAAYHEFLRALPQPAEGHTEEQVVEDLAGLLTPVDAGYLTGEFATYFDHSGRRGREQGVVGWRDDGLSIVGDWGFDPRAITAPVAVWHGREDAMVPFGHGEWLAERLPGAVPHFLDHTGHLSMWERADEVLRDLAARY